MTAAPPVYLCKLPLVEIQIKRKRSAFLYEQARTAAHTAREREQRSRSRAEQRARTATEQPRSTRAESNGQKAKRGTHKEAKGKQRARAGQSCNRRPKAAGQRSGNKAPTQNAAPASDTRAEAPQLPAHGSRTRERHLHRTTPRRTGKRPTYPPKPPHAKVGGERGGYTLGVVSK